MPLIKYTKNGEEIPDSTKPEVPLGFKKPESLAEQVRRLVRSEQMRLAAQSQGFETFEEADDFDVGDDFDPRSPYEEVFDPTADPEAPVPGATEPPPAKETTSSSASPKERSSKKGKKGERRAPGARATQPDIEEGSSGDSEPELEE